MRRLDQGGEIRARVVSAGLESDRVQERWRRKPRQVREPVSERLQLGEVRLDQRRLRECAQSFAELLLHRRVGVDGVVVAVGEDRLLRRLAGSNADNRARPRLALGDPGLKPVYDAKRDAGAAARWLLAQEGEQDRMNGAGL